MRRQCKRQSRMALPLPQCLSVRARTQSQRWPTRPPHACTRLRRSGPDTPQETARSNDAGRRGEGIRIPRRAGRSIEDSSACAACWLCSAVKSYGDGKFQGAFLLAAMDGRPRAGGDNERGTAKTTNKCSCENDGSAERRGRPPGKGSKQARSKKPRVAAWVG